MSSKGLKAIVGFTAGELSAEKVFILDLCGFIGASPLDAKGSCITLAGTGTGVVDGPNPSNAFNLVSILFSIGMGIDAGLVVDALKSKLAAGDTLLGANAGLLEKASKGFTLTGCAAGCAAATGKPNASKLGAEIEFLCEGANPPCCDVDGLKPPDGEKPVAVPGADANPPLVANPVVDEGVKPAKAFAGAAPGAVAAVLFCVFGTMSSNAANGLGLPLRSISSKALYYSPRCLHSVFFQ